MRLEDKIINLLSGITDVSVRIEIMRTIKFLYDVYREGRADPEQILNDLTEICYHIVTLKDPLMPEMDKRKKARELAEDIFQAFTLQSISRRVFLKYTQV